MENGITPYHPKSGRREAFISRQVLTICLAHHWRRTAAMMLSVLTGGWKIAYIGDLMSP
jgi:hypothetical protein